MPIYEFICQACERPFECLVGMGRESDARCAHCGSAEVRKRVSAFGIGGGGSRLKSSSAGCGTCTAKSCSTCR